MNYYKDTSGGLHALSDADIDNGGEFLLPSGCIRISDEEATRAQAPSLADLSDQIRAERNARINELLWMVHRHEQQERAGLKPDLSEDDYIALLHHLQNLRDVTSQKGFPDKVKWPTPPAFIK
jgi:hypothetical protein